MSGTLHDVERDGHVRIVFATLCAAISILAIAIALH
jgi:hypothetical protein